MREKHQNMGCEDFRRALASLIEVDDTDKRNAGLLKHLENCRGCRDYYNTILLLRKQMQKFPAGEIKPRSGTLGSILSTMNYRNRSRARIIKRPWDTVRRIFEIRIPVYQVLAGAVVLFYLFFFLSNHYRVAPDDKGLPAIFEKQNNTQSSELYAVDTLHQQENTQGMNAREDSVLISFLVPSL
jgi:hypothetical protein